MSIMRKPVKIPVRKEKEQEELVDKPISTIASKFREEHAISVNAATIRPATSDHFLVEIMKILSKDGELLADDKNQAFSQLNMGGKLKQIFETVDETKEFALAYNYAMHPLDEIQKDFSAMNILDSQEKPICFQVDVLQAFIDEWMRKRVPANRLRVEEFIKLKQAVREYVQGGMAGNVMPKESSQEKRKMW